MAEGTWSAYTVNSIASRLIAELGRDRNTSGGTVPDRLKEIIRECGITLWTCHDWRFRRRSGTFSITTGGTSATVPADFAELDQRRMRESSDYRWPFLMHDDPDSYQEMADRYETGASGPPTDAILVRDYTGETFTWVLKVAPAADQGYSVPFWYLVADPWTNTPIDDATAPVWPPEFHRGWYLLARSQAAAEYMTEKEATARYKLYRDWLTNQIDQDETITHGGDRIRDGYGDYAKTASRRLLLG